MLETNSILQLVTLHNFLAYNNSAYQTPDLEDADLYYQASLSFSCTYVHSVNDAIIRVKLT